jgi:hypothetical protein
MATEHLMKDIGKGLMGEEEGRRVLERVELIRLRA